MKREIIRIEPLSTYLERWKAPTSTVTRSGNTLYVSGFPTPERWSTLRSNARPSLSYSR